MTRHQPARNALFLTHLLTAGVKVAFSVSNQSPSAATAVASTLSALSTSSQSMQALQAALQAAGLSALSGVELIAAPAVSTAVVLQGVSSAAVTLKMAAAPWRYLAAAAVAALAM